MRAACHLGNSSNHPLYFPKEVEKQPGRRGRREGGSEGSKKRRERWMVWGKLERNVFWDNTKSVCVSFSSPAQYLCFSSPNSIRSTFILLFISSHKQTKHWEAFACGLYVLNTHTHTRANKKRDAHKTQVLGVICCFDTQLNQSACHHNHSVSGCQVQTSIWGT